MTGTFTSSYDATRLRADFPMLSQTVNGKPLVYLDNAATTHKPRLMIDRLQDIYSNHFAKDVEKHTFSEQLTGQIEAARAKVAHFVGAAGPENIVFLQNATEALAILAEGFTKMHLQPGDEIVLTGLEHHSNIIPWLIAAETTGATIRVAPVTDKGEVDVDAVTALFTNRTKVVSVSHVSHVIGTILPVREITEAAHTRGIPVILDGAQATPHMPLDMRDLGCDFYVMCGHKTYGPTSVGMLYGTGEWLERLPAWEGGSDNAETVTFEGWTPKAPPKKFEAGTQALADIIALGSSLDYLAKIGMDPILRYERGLIGELIDRLERIDGIRVLGRPLERVGLASFTIDGVQDVQDVEVFLDQEYGVAVRAGDMTAQPLMKRLGVPGAIRASMGLYNTREDVDTFIQGIEHYVREHRA